MSESSRDRQQHRKKKAGQLKANQSGGLHATLARWFTKWEHLKEHDLPTYLILVGTASIIWFFIATIAATWIQDTFNAKWREEAATELAAPQTRLHAALFSLLAGCGITIFGAACHFSERVKSYRASLKGKSVMITVFIGIMGGALFVWLWKASNLDNPELPTTTAESGKTSNETDTSKIMPLLISA